jgi:hypothetical protein
VSRRRSNLPLLVGAALSLALHGLVIIPTLIAVVTASPQTLVVQARFEPEDFQEPDPPRPEDAAEPEVALGIDAPTPSTLTWVGYEEYERHLAALGETDQAAFAMNPSSPGAAMPSPPAASAGADGEAADEAAASDAAESADALASAPPATMLQMSDLMALRRWLDAALPAPGESPSDASSETEQALRELMAVLKPADSDEPATEREPQPAPPQPSPVPIPQGSEPEHGEPAEKESDATSIMQVPLEEIDPGKPLAGAGLQIMTVRPRFNNFLRLTASPGNPLVEIRFGRDGKPRIVQIVYSSGDARIDHVIQRTLYSWRAAGEELNALEGEQTINVRIQIILNPRARGF